MDENVLLWKHPPPSTPETDAPTDKLTLITCTNMDATHKLSLNVVGNYPEPTASPTDVTPPSDVTQPTMLFYRKGDTHELTTEIFRDWFHATFVPQVRASLEARDLPPKAVLILDNSPYHPEGLAEGQITTIRIPCYIANKSLPSATISKFLKARYKARVARQWVEDKEFCNNLSLMR